MVRENVKDVKKFYGPNGPPYSSAPERNFGWIAQSSVSSGRHPDHCRDSKTADVLQRLLHANVTLNVEKCTFSQNKVKFLGQVVGKDGVEVDPSKVEVISEMKAPTDVSQLRRCQGMI